MLLEGIGVYLHQATVRVPIVDIDAATAPAVRDAAISVANGEAVDNIDVAKGGDADTVIPYCIDVAHDC